MAKQKFEIKKHVMTGISYMIPIVVCGGILSALAKGFGGYDIGSAVEAGATPFSNLNPFTWIGFWWGVNKLGSIAMDFAVAVMTAGVAYSIAGRPGHCNWLLFGSVESGFPWRTAHGIYHRGICELDENLENAEVV